MLRSFRRYRELGINMGTDTAPPDMVLNLAVALMMGRAATGDARWPTTAEVFDTAVIVEPMR